MPEEVGIVMKLHDQVSPTLKTISKNSKVFSKDMDDLEEGIKSWDKAQEELIKHSANLTMALKEADEKVKDAQKSYRKLRDETSRGALEDAIEEQVRLKNELKETEVAIKNNLAGYDQMYKQARNAAEATSRANNRAGETSEGIVGLANGLITAGVIQKLGDSAGQLTDTLMSSAIGEPEARMASSVLSGAVSGAAMGSVIPGIGTAAGAVIGGISGALSGWNEIYQSQDEAFREYYKGQYEEGLTARQESLSAGIATASQRELDAIAFDRLLGEGVGTEYLSDLRRLAADTPLEYSDLTQMSRALATGFGDSPERMLELMQAIGDAGSAVGVTASDMTTMAQAMSRMQSSGKATLEYLNILQERGVNVIGMLAEEYGKTQGEIYDMISKSEINGRDAVSIIQAGMTESYSGAMDRMSETFSGLTSTLEDTMTEIDNARGEGYNTIRSQGLEAEIGAYGGALGDAMQALNRISGQNEAFLENLSEQYTREALSAVLLGEDTTLFGREQQQDLRDMRAQYALAEQQYAEGREEAGLEMESLARQAESLAQTAYESSEEYAMMRETELDLIGAIRENTAALDSWKYDFEQSQEFSKGRMATVNWDAMSEAGGIADSAPVSWGLNEYGIVQSSSGSAGGMAGPVSLSRALAGHASGLRRVPYDGYAAILHMGERVLTAREAREQDRTAAGGGISINISGQWSVRSDDDVDRVAEAIVRKVELAQRAGVRV